MSAKVQHTLDALSTAARLDIPAEKMAGVDLASVRGTLRELASRTTYTPEEAECAGGVVEEIKASLQRAMSGGALGTAEYQGTYNLFNALQDVQFILRDIQLGGTLGFSRGFVSAGQIVNELNAQLFSVDRLMGGKLAPYSNGGLLSPEDPKLLDVLSSIKEKTLEHMRDRKLGSTERLVFEQFLQTLVSAV
jgi:hypothetical protein